MKSKKGVELTMQTIVVFILILIVLAISIYFIGFGGGRLGQSTECETSGYTCVGKDDPCLQKMPLLKCEGEGKVCCMEE